MALNPDRVADILFIELNRNARGKWDAGNFAYAVNEKANDTLTTPEIFADWLLLRILLKPSVDSEIFKDNLIEQLKSAELRIAAPDVEKTRVHKVLFIEKQGNIIDQTTMFMRSIAVSAGISTEKITFVHQSQPPYESKQLSQLLHEFTGALLHNLSPDHLFEIASFVDAYPEMKSRITVIRTNASNPDLERAVQQLVERGIPVLSKPYDLTRATLPVFGLYYE